MIQRCVLAVLGAAWIAGCQAEADIVWRQFNGDDDSLQIEVREGAEEGVATVDLTSNTGVVIVGEASVTPAIAPVGTDHTLVIVVGEDWGERIPRATVTTTGDRGEDRYDLIQDTAQAGVFRLKMESLGEEGEARVDRWLIQLWEPIDAPLPDFEEGT